MRRVLMMLLFLTLAGCGGGGVREHVFAPTLSVQQLAVQADGRWALELRLKNFSNVGMRMDDVDAQLRVGGVDAGTIRFSPRLTVAPESAEILEFVLMPSAAAAEAVSAAVARGASVRYAIDGTIHSSEPRNRRDEFAHENHLSAVPGLSGILR